MIIVLHQFHYAEYANEVQTLNAPQKKLIIKNCGFKTQIKGKKTPNI